MNQGLNWNREKINPLLIFNHFVDQTDHLAGFGVPLGLEFGINQLSVHTNLKAAAVGRHQRKSLDQVFKLLE